MKVMLESATFEKEIACLSDRKLAELGVRAIVKLQETNTQEHADIKKRLLQLEGRKKLAVGVSSSLGGIIGAVVVAIYNAIGNRV